MKRLRGFTIVELLVVIVVIAILAAIIMVSYANVQKSARDSVRKQDVATLAKAFETYNADNGPMYNGSNCGSGGSGLGWMHYDYPGYTSMINCLMNAKAISKNMLPPSKTTVCSSGNLSCDAYMKYSCLQAGKNVTYIYANLETIPHTTTDTDSTCPSASTIDTSYGMNYFVKLVDR